MKTLIVTLLLSSSLSFAAPLNKADCELILSIPETTDQWRQAEYGKCLEESSSIDEQMVCATKCDPEFFGWDEVEANKCFHQCLAVDQMTDAGCQ
ncbi:hypothetical protein [Bdellovibrio reynosensis]|uniref:Uncharacterized protein n=1 Tax=Bdellovibrio reynosensis TaxID=2835041 RepID=A0ABY4CGR9_9BACT|nr:hypothetical protein [Bdellovibrio reynosensis]UOF01405.1 hypothetical protein MNR06_00365 [Bdellovibrio reynosensis]